MTDGVMAGLIAGGITGAITLVGSLSGGLVWIGYHRREHKVLMDKDMDLDTRVNAFYSEHLETTRHCPVHQIEVEHKEVMIAVQEVRDQRIDLTSGNERFRRIEADISSIQNKLEHLMSTKLDTLAGKVDRILGYMSAKDKGHFEGGGI